MPHLIINHTLQILAVRVACRLAIRLIAVLDLFASRAARVVMPDIRWPVDGRIIGCTFHDYPPPPPISFLDKTILNEIKGVIMAGFDQTLKYLKGLRDAVVTVRLPHWK